MSERFAYVARRPCGCMIAAAVDDPKYAKDNAKEISRWIRDGLTIERVSVERVRAEFKSCPHGTVKAQRAAAQRSLL